MYSKTRRTATALVRLCIVVLLASCASAVPWRNEPVGDEVNLAFVLQNNLVFLPSATLDGRPARILFGSAAPRLLVDPKFGTSDAPHSVQLNGRQSLQLPGTPLGLGGVADAIMGADAWGAHTIAVDYHAGLVIFQRQPIQPAQMSMFSFAHAANGMPMVNVLIDGRSVSAVVDTTSPDTLVLPRGSAPAGRTRAHVQLASADFGMLDVRLADVTTPRVGNRVLSKFLLAIDYGRKQVGLWRDPRTAM
jgi:hypothetical protein